MLEDNLVPQHILPYSVWKYLRTSAAYILKTFDLNDIKFDRVVKMPFSITFQKFCITLFFMKPHELKSISVALLILTKQFIERNEFSASLRSLNSKL